MAGRPRTKQRREQALEEQRVIREAHAAADAAREEKIQQRLTEAGQSDPYHALVSSRRYDEDDLRHAMDIFLTQGPAAAARLTGIPAPVIRYWADRLEIAPPAESSLRVEQAQRGMIQHITETRQELALLISETAVDLIRRMHQPHLDHKVVSIAPGQQEVVAVLSPLPPASAVRDYAIATAILVDKLRLEMGDVSARVEVRAPDQFDAIVRDPTTASALEDLFRKIGNTAAFDEEAAASREEAQTQRVSLEAAQPALPGV